MGTSKGYIFPTKPEWTSAKRAVSLYLRNRDSESRANAMSKYVAAMASTNAVSSNAFSTSAGCVLGFAKGVSGNGLNETLIEFGRQDLIGKDSGEILDAIMGQFTNGSATLEDSLAADAISKAFENLEIEIADDLGKVDIDQLLGEMVIEFININFDLRFDERIGKGRTPAEKATILEDMHNYVANTLHGKLNAKQISKLDFSRLQASEIVKRTLEDAYATFQEYYGGDES